MCDVRNLKLESSRFIENLRAYFSDKLYFMKTIQGRDTFIFKLLENSIDIDKHLYLNKITAD
ncbi:Rpn family recombination-promoting nuclease/putative transposase [Budvicia aquatica]|uniref:Rpn family recombination-promoting nuclease/putative transposase n=1 Tax=Budvicia aquatica TaxID=82979 RepID=UPI003D157FBD